MSNRIAIFDGNHLAYRAFYKFSNLRTLDGTKTSIIYGMPYIAESLIRRLGPDQVAVVFDGGRHYFRTDILPEYKQRDKKLGFDAENFHSQKDVAKTMFMALGLKVAQRKGFEADDIIAQITRRYSMSGWEVVIVSADKDFNQLITGPYEHYGPVTVFNVNKGKEINEFNIKDITGYSSERCVDYLALIGDNSDNIKGYPCIGPARAAQMFERFGSVDGFLKSKDSFGKVNKEKLKVIWRRNKKLIDLKYFYRKFLMNEPIPWINSDAQFLPGTLKQLCNTYEINSFLKQQFIKTFKQLQDGK